MVDAAAGRQDLLANFDMHARDFARGIFGKSPETSEVIVVGVVSVNSEQMEVFNNLVRQGVRNLGVHVDVIQPDPARPNDMIFLYGADHHKPNGYQALRDVMAEARLGPDRSVTIVRSMAASSAPIQR